MTARPVSRKSENGAKLAKAPRSSAPARRLAKAALKRYGSLRKAASALGIKSHGQLYAIMNGRMYDTPEMKAALRRADRRAKRAWELVRDEGPRPRVDVEALRGSIQAIEYQLRLMRETLKRSGVEVVTLGTDLCADGIVVDDPIKPPDAQSVNVDKYVREILAPIQAPGLFESGQVNAGE